MFNMRRAHTRGRFLSPREFACRRRRHEFLGPGFFGSLAAAPQQPGWSLANIYYQTNVSGGSEVALAKDYEIGKVPVGLMANLNASVHGTGDIGFVIATYVFATPVWAAKLRSAWRSIRHLERLFEWDIVRHAGRPPVRSAER